MGTGLPKRLWRWKRAGRPELMGIYHVLYAAFGPQGWWPGETPFEVVTGAILTQSTNWRNVEKAVAHPHFGALLINWEQQEGDITPHQNHCGRAASYQLGDYVLAYRLSLAACRVGVAVCRCCRLYCDPSGAVLRDSPEIQTEPFC